MAHREYMQWVEFYQLEPWGEERGDLRAGIIASTFANVMRDPKKGKPLKPKDFMPTFRRPQQKQTLQEMASVMKQYAAAVKGANRGRRS